MTIPSEKDRKYDRQLRLWAASGQKALEEAHICLIGATATGSEIVKNLVLPGIGKLTVVDDKLVTKDDLCNNFFVQEEHLGTSRARAVQLLVKELNPDVKTEYVEKAASELLQVPDGDSDKKYNNFFSEFSLVIACDVNPSTLSQLNDLLFEKNIALMTADSVGFYGVVRISKREHTIIETHPDTLADARLTSPWPELVEFSQSFYDLEKFDESDLSHIPYVILLLIYLDRYKTENNGQLPNTFAEKKKLREAITNDSIKLKLKDAQNFEEAAGAVLRAVQPMDIPSSVTALCDQLDPEGLDKNTPDFWILVGALKKFIQECNVLPQPGVLPDMKADTKSFISLQQIYRDKARQDATAIDKYVKEIVQRTAHEDISWEDVETFCKNSRFIRAMHGSKLNECKLPSNAANTDDESNLIHQYIGIQAYKLFLQEQGRVPGLDTSSNDQTDYNGLISRAEAIAQSKMGIQNLPEGTKKALAEILRAGGAELHSIAAFLGGVGGQEAIKLLTHQYGALDNCVVYDGIKCTTGAYKF